MPDDVGKRASTGQHHLPDVAAGQVPFLRTPLFAPVYGFVIAGVLTVLLGGLFAGGPENSGSVVVNQDGIATSTTQTAETTTTVPTPALTTPPVSAPTTPPTSAPTTAPLPPPVAAGPSLPIPLVIKAVAAGAGVPPSTFTGYSVTFSGAGKKGNARLQSDGSATVQIAALPLDEVCLTPKAGWQVDTSDGVSTPRDNRTACQQGLKPPPSGQAWTVTFVLTKAGQ